MLPSPDKCGQSARTALWAILAVAVSVATVSVLVIYVVLPALGTHPTTRVGLPMLKRHPSDSTYRIVGATGTPDGSLWFTEEQYQPAQSNTDEGPAKIGHVTTGGTLSEYPLAAGNGFPFDLDPFVSPQLTLGADGNLWFAEEIGRYVHTALPQDAVGKIDPAGHITEYRLPFPSNLFFQPSFADSLVRGPDGNMWFLADVATHLGTSPGTTTAVSELASITPEGTITAQPLSGASGLFGSLTVGPDGNFWTTVSHVAADGTVGDQRIARITPAAVVTTYQRPAAGESALGFTVGGDGHLWSIASPSSDSLPIRVLRISLSGEIMEFPLPSDQSTAFPFLVANGGSIWFEGVSYSCTTTPCQLGQTWVDSITPDGTVSEHKVPAGSTVEALYNGPDGNLYYVGLSLQTVPFSGNNRLGRVTPTGEITEYAVSTARQDTFNLVAGTGKTLWLTGSVQTNEQGSSTITRITLP